MKVDKLDLAWSVVSMIIVGVSYRRGQLPQGLILIYVIMAAIFAWHIYVIRRRMKGSVPVYGTIVDYHVSRKSAGRLSGYFPVVKYETETGRSVISVYTVEAMEKQFDEGSEELICYDPEEPMFFYFANREDEMYRDYFRLIVFGGCIAGMIAMYLLIRK